MSTCWQAQAIYPGGRVLVFGIEAPDLPPALLKAYQRAAELPGVADHLTVARLTGSRRPPPPAAQARPQTGVDGNG